MSVLFKADDLEFELVDHDLPKEMPTGAQLRKVVTRYAGTYASVQVNGVEFSPIELEGVFDDSWWGEIGHAKSMRNQIEAIQALGQIVRLEYDDVEFWGTLDCKFTIKTNERIEYRITFDPFWRQDPTAQIYLAFAEPPNDLAETLSARLESTSSFFENAPSGIDAAFVGDIVLGLASVRNSISNILGYITDVADYADLTEQQIGLVTRSLFAGIKTMTSANSRLRSAGTGILQNNAEAWTRGGDYIYEGRYRAQQSTEDLVAMLRRFLEESRPKRQQTHIFRQGDSLQSLAKLYLGDFSRWVEIADANDLDSTTVAVGTVLKIPRR